MIVIEANLTFLFRAQPIVKPPLYPARSVVVFVFEEATDSDWILKTAELDNSKSNFTVSWVVDLTNRSLKKHYGPPPITSGGIEIQKALR